MKRLFIVLFVLLLATITQSATSAAGSVHPFADVAVSFRYAPHNTRPGVDVAYMFAVSNEGPSAARDVVLTVNIAPQIVDLTTYDPDGMRCVLNQMAGAASQYLCVLDTMPPGLVYNVGLKGHLLGNTPSGTYYQAMASVLTSTADPATANNVAVSEDTTQ